MVFMNLFENVNAHELKIKFKGWESVRWLEEQEISQEEQERIGHHLVWSNVTYSSDLGHVC